MDKKAFIFVTAVANQASGCWEKYNRGKTPEGWHRVFQLKSHCNFIAVHQDCFGLVNPSLKNQVSSIKKIINLISDKNISSINLHIHDKHLNCQLTDTISEKNLKIHDVEHYNRIIAKMNRKNIPCLKIYIFMHEAQSTINNFLVKSFQTDVNCRGLLGSFEIS